MEDTHHSNSKHSSEYTSLSSNDDKEALDLADTLVTQLLMAILSYVIMLHSFQPIELSRENQIYVNPAVPVHDVLAQLRATPDRFKDLTNFTVEEFIELCARVTPTIAIHAQSTGRRMKLPGQPCKLTPEQRLMNFILYMKHDNVVHLDSFMWNWARCAVCDDAIFVASCLNEALAQEIQWPDREQRRQLAQRIRQLPGCVGIVDGTLCKIRRPWDNPNHLKWFQGRKKMYCLNSTVIVDHDGLFIYIDPGYPGSYHDVTILRHSHIERNWRQMFTHVNANYCEYILGDQGYTGMERYIMRGFSRVEIVAMQLDNNTALKAFNKMVLGYRVRVEWGIGGLKMKWRRLQKRLDLVKPKFNITF